MNKQKNYYKTIWISDIHLGTKGSNVELLNNFLNHHKCDNLFLVGDIFDFWQLRRKSYFPQSHIKIVHKFLNKLKKNTKVFYIVGNHDETLRKYSEYFDTPFIENFFLGNEYIYNSISGEILWITHGDLYDSVTVLHSWIAHLGDVGYNFLLLINKYYNFFRKVMGFPYWSLSSYIKKKIKMAVSFINNFEDILVFQCKKRECSGVICGHIHVPEIKNLADITYYNCGDWVENCSALVEHFDGKIELIFWKIIKDSELNEEDINCN